MITEKELVNRNKISPALVNSFEEIKEDFEEKNKIIHTHIELLYKIRPTCYDKFEKITTIVYNITVTIATYTVLYVFVKDYMY